MAEFGGAPLLQDNFLRDNVFRSDRTFRYAYPEVRPHGKEQGCVVDSNCVRSLDVMMSLSVEELSKRQVRDGTIFAMEMMSRSARK